MTGIVAQICLNSVVAGLTVSLVAIGFTYIFRVTRVFHLAHGAVYIAGAFSFWWALSQSLGWVGSAAMALSVATILGYIFEKTVYSPLRRNQTNQSISLIASMGLYVVIVNALALLFGNDNKTILDPVTGTIEIGSIILTRVQLIQTVVGITTIAAFFLYLKFTKSNLAMRAVSDNETISKAYGINTEKERTRVFIAGSILACIAAILRTIEVGVDPHAGMGITLTAAVIAILVSRLNALLVIAFTIVLTLLQNTVEWFLDAQWRDGITFLILLVAILFRTEGIISYNLRKDRA
ncbi:MAG: branched-chain amino acid ABC transporter permease [Acidobacteria bacterium]|nr:branched-chain amino acid ABC transporter permease [Acidobacteriota bacterium]